MTHVNAVGAAKTWYNDVRQMVAVIDEYVLLCGLRSRQVPPSPVVGVSS